jgi:hypothetical protein
VVTTQTRSAPRRRQIHDVYSNGQPRPLRAYSAVLGTYATLVSLAAAVGRARAVRLPERFTAQDTVLLCAATHKASRLLSKEAVTSPLRAPFTRYEQATGEAEVNESVRGGGVRHAVGELVTCPFCLGVWVATGLTAGMVFAPRVTRLVTSALTAIAASDVAQLVYDGLKKNVGG